MGLLDILLGSSSSNGELKVGDFVEVLTYGGEEGEIIEIHGNDYYVEIEDENGHIEVDSFKASELRKIR